MLMNFDVTIIETYAITYMQYIRVHFKTLMLNTSLLDNNLILLAKFMIDMHEAEYFHFEKNHDSWSMASINTLVVRKLYRKNFQQ